MIRAIAAWSLSAAGLLAATGTIVDISLLVGSAAPAGAIAASAAAAAALGWLLGCLAGPFLAALARVTCKLCPRNLGLACTVPGAVTAWLVLSPLERRAALAYAIIAAVSGAAVGLAAFLHRSQPVHLSVASAAMIAVAAVAADIAVPATTYPELHDAALLVLLAAGLASVAPWRRRLSRHPRVVWIALGASAASLAVIGAVSLATDGWRSYAVERGRHFARSARLLRSVVDVDGDGFSPIAWGTDCDDFDSDVHPLAVDSAGGGDRNCNGVDPPGSPSAADRGLAPPEGQAAFPRGTVDLVLLITVDTWRIDAVGPALTPALHALGARGVVFERAYAAGAATLLSLPLLQRAADTAPLLAELLRARGMDAAGAISYDVDRDNFGLARITELAPGELDAARLTDAALAFLQTPSDEPRFLWVHYFEPHMPFVAHKGFAPAEPAHLPAAYRSELAFSDHHIGRLLDGLDLARTAVIVTGDHGEGIGEHPGVTHNASGYDEVLRVPALFVAPGVGAQRYPGLVSHRDIPATILGALGLSDHAGEAEAFGRSWVRLADAPDAPLHEFVVSRSTRLTSGVKGRNPLAAITMDKWKLVASFDDQLMELYDLEQDPSEKRNAIGRHPDIAADLWRKLALFCDLDGFPSASP